MLRTLIVRLWLVVVVVRVCDGCVCICVMCVMCVSCYDNVLVCARDVGWLRAVCCLRVCCEVCGVGYGVVCCVLSCKCVSVCGCGCVYGRACMYVV